MPLYPPLVGSGSAVAAPKPGPYNGLPVVALHNHHAGPYNVVAATSQNARIAHVLCEDVVEIRLVYVNWSAGEVSGVNPLTVAAGVEFPLATIYPVTFGGSDTTVIAADGIRVSDPIPIDAASGSTIYSRTYCSAPTSFPVMRSAVPSTSEAAENGAGLANKSLSGTIGTQAFPVGCYCPSAVIGVTKSGRTRTWVAVLGDSIPNGQGDFYQSSYAIRALDAGNVPFLNVAKGGESAQTYAALSTSRRRRQLSTGATYVLDQHGTNDANGGRTLAQLQADKLTIWFAYANRGSKVYAQTITTRPSASSDGWTTLSGQTANASSVGANYNAWLRDGAPINATTLVAVAVGTSANTLRAGQTGHPLSVNATYAPQGYIEVADAFESARDSGKVKVPGVSGTGDISTGTNTILNATGAWQVGHIVVGTGIPAGALVGTVAGTTLTLVNGNKLAVNATATTVGLAIAAAYSVDGIHPSPALHALMAAAIPTALFA